MARDGAGTHNRIHDWTADAAAAINISSSRMDAEMDDMANELTNSIAADGQTNPTANLKMATFKHTNVGDASATDQYGVVGQIQDGGYVWGATAGGTADAITFSPSPAIAAYAEGQKFRFIAAAANTGAVTVDVASVGAKAVKKYGGTALAANDIPGAGAIVEVTYDGTDFELDSIGTFAAKEVDSNVTKLDGSQRHTGNQFFRQSNYSADTGSANTYVVTVHGSFDANDLVDGCEVTFIPANTNTGGASTLNVNSTGAKVIRTYQGDKINRSLLDGDIIAGQPCTVRYNTSFSEWVLMSRSVVQGLDLADNLIDWATHLEVETAGSIPVWDASSNPALLGPGTAGQTLVTQGASATPVWADQFKNVEVIATASAVWTLPDGVTNAVILCIGGGGAGAGNATGSFGTGGGGGGGAIMGYVTVSADTTVNCGAGGTGDTDGGATGGDTTFGAIATAKGGVGGVSGSNGAGGAGGAKASNSLTGTILLNNSGVTGEDGSDGAYGGAGGASGFNSVDADGIAVGSALVAAAGAARQTGVDTTGNAGTKAGDGGSGIRRTSGSITGGDGADGLVVIWY